MGEVTQFASRRRKKRSKPGGGRAPGKKRGGGGEKTQKIDISTEEGGKIYFSLSKGVVPDGRERRLCSRGKGPFA